jgi:hypothetical protein
VNSTSSDHTEYLKRVLGGEGSRKGKRMTGMYRRHMALV